MAVKSRARNCRGKQNGFLENPTYLESDTVNIGSCEKLRSAGGCIILWYYTRGRQEGVKLTATFYSWKMGSCHAPFSSINSCPFEYPAILS